MRAGRIALLAGDGLASGDGTEVVFRVQAADAPGNAANLSANPLDVEIPVVSRAKAIAGAYARVLINADGALTPGETTFNSWKARVATGTLHLRVGLVGKQDGDVLSLRSGYDASKITPDWDESIGELWLEIGDGTTVAEMQAALALLEFESALSDSASTRNVWLFPTIAGQSDVAYRFDPAAGLVRYYYYDNTARSFSDASEKAPERTADGRGYLGVPASDAEKTIYRDLITGDIHLAISDDPSVGTTEGKWVVTDGPRKGQLFWDHVASSKVYGPGADGSGWSVRSDFWHGGNPDNRRDSEDYARMDWFGRVYDDSAGDRGSVIHEDFVLFGSGIFGRGIFARVLEVAESPPNPVLRVDFDRLRVDSGQRLELTEKHISIYDPDTTDASKVRLRVTGLTGGELQRRSSSSAGDWTKIVANPSEAYLEFTLAELRTGRIAFLAGDGLASGEGTKVIFQVQAADDGMPGDPASSPNLSDFDPLTPEKDPVGADIVIVTAAKVTAGFRGLLNADRVLAPDAATLSAWRQEATTHRGTLHVVVRLGNMQDGDALSLVTGYDASKVTPRWVQDKRELSLEIASGATEADIRAALEFLELKTDFSNSASTRKVWVFPTLSGVSGFGYRVDETAGLVRYYLYDSISRSFADATTAAAGRSLFGKHGYLGVPTSSPEKSIYKEILPRYSSVLLAISDDPSAGTTEGKWVITAGPRKGQLFWDHTADPKEYGPGADGSGWDVQGDFWTTTPRGGTRENYARVYNRESIYDVSHTRWKSVAHHDLQLQAGDILSRRVDVQESPPDPLLEVDFSEVRATALRPLILTQDHISVEDPDTRDPSDPTKVDANKIELRITNIPDGTLHVRASVLATAPWVAMSKAVVGGASRDYYAFTLAQLQGELVSLLPNAAGTLTFEVQAADDKIRAGEPQRLRPRYGWYATGKHFDIGCRAQDGCYRRGSAHQRRRRADPGRRYARRVACRRQLAADIRVLAERQERDFQAQHRGCARAPFGRHAQRVGQQDFGFVGPR